MASEAGRSECEQWVLRAVLILPKMQHSEEKKCRIRGKVLCWFASSQRFCRLIWKQCGRKGCCRSRGNSLFFTVTYWMKLEQCYHTYNKRQNVSEEVREAFLQRLTPFPWCYLFSFWWIAVHLKALRTVTVLGMTASILHSLHGGWSRCNSPVWLWSKCCCDWLAMAVVARQIGAPYVKCMAQLKLLFSSLNGHVFHHKKKTKCRMSFHPH